MPPRQGCPRRPFGAVIVFPVLVRFNAGRSRDLVSSGGGSRPLGQALAQPSLYYTAGGRHDTHLTETRLGANISAFWQKPAPPKEREPQASNARATTGKEHPHKATPASKPTQAEARNLRRQDTSGRTPNPAPTETTPRPNPTTSRPKTPKQPRRRRTRSTPAKHRRHARPPAERKANQHRANSRRPPHTERREDLTTQESRNSHSKHLPAKREKQSPHGQSVACAGYGEAQCPNARRGGVSRGLAQVRGFPRYNESPVRASSLPKFCGQSVAASLHAKRRSQRKGGRAFQPSGS